MKKVISVTLSLLLFVTMFTFCVSAADKKSGDYTYKVLEDGTVQIVEYTGHEPILSIPEEIDGKKVTVLGTSAIRYGELKEVTIPKTVETIRYYTFKDCYNLEKVTFEPGLKTILDEAFFSCVKLKSIDIPDTVISIGDSAFAECYSLSDIKLGKNIQNIYENTFSPTAFIKNKENYEGAFLYLDNYLLSVDRVELNGQKTVKIKDGITTIAGYSLSMGDYPSIETLILPDSVKYIGYSAVYDNENLKTVKLGKSVEKIGARAFEGCTSLTNIDLPNSVTTIGRQAFYGCYNLESIKLSDNLTNIGKYAFVKCLNLKNIKIPASVKKIGKMAFGYEWVSSKYAYVPIKGVSITGYANTAAEKYAEKYNIEFNCQKPKTPKAKITKKGKKIRVKCSNLVGADGIQVRYTVGKKTYTKNYNSKLTSTKTLSNLKKGKYKVKVRAFANQNGKKLYSKWTKVKTVKVK